MIARVSRASSGLSTYLRDGQRKDSEYTRDQKDHTIPLFGDLDIFEKTENFLNTHKDFKYNYMHITLSFSKEDMRRIEESGLNREDVYSDMVETYIKHHTSGYDLDNEVIAYAEAHIPKIKEEHDKERLDHIHIAIALYNPRDNTKLRTDFKTSNFLDDTLQEYVNKKHGLTNPRESSRIREGINANTDMAKNRKYYINELKDIQNNDELIGYFKENKIEFREVKTAKNHYFKIITPGEQVDINLRGKGFEHLSDIVQGKEIVNNKNRDVEELENILGNHYKKRIDLIHGRRSVLSKNTIESIYNDKELLQKETGENVIYPSFKQKLFQKHYAKVTDNKFIGYRIDLNAEIVKFTNKSKGIEVTDHGDKITSGNTGDLTERAFLMLDIVEAKEWPLNTLRITGSEDFKKEIHKQIAERLKEREELLKISEALKIKRPISEAEQIVSDRIDEKKIEKLAEKIDLSAIKTQLNAATVLTYAADKYKLNAANYEITADNKINNLSNKQKPKNVIDFLQKEINLTGKESIEICEELFKNQPLKIQAVPIGTKEKSTIRKKDYAPTREQQAVALRESHTQSNSRRKTNTTDNLPILSASKLVSDIQSVELLLQNYDDLDLQRRSQELGNRLRYTNARDDQVAVAGGSAISGDLKMPLKLSICKDTNLNALNQWETVEVTNYTALATLMKQYPYSAAQFENGYRNSDNARSSVNILIYDIDNDPGKPQLTISEAQEMLKVKGVSAMIIPSKSHNVDKKGHIAERFRIVVPTADTIPAKIGKEEYREFQKLTCKALDLDRFVDTKAMNDKARFYYKSPINAVPIVIKADLVMKIDPFVQQALSNLNARKAEAEKERQRIAQIRRNIAKHQQTTGETASRHLTHADVDKLMSLQIAELIKHLEKAEEYKEGDYHMLKTDSSKYSVVEENVVHDFKNDVTYNNITLLQKYYKTQNLNAIARELEKETGESYVKTNVEEVHRAIEEAMKDAINDKALEETLKEHFDVKYCKLDTSKETITIADKKIKFSDIRQNKEQLVKQFRENRERDGQRRKGPSLRFK